ncbi:hypothetical protein F5888DRAFT_197565 [Russula emetica]|nr:hypothetical protein F5888DRAFT_197565 [Russula emetica]
MRARQFISLCSEASRKSRVGESGVDKPLVQLFTLFPFLPCYPLPPPPGREVSHVVTPLVIIFFPCPTSRRPVNPTQTMIGRSEYTARRLLPPYSNVSFLLLLARVKEFVLIQRIFRTSRVKDCQQQQQQQQQLAVLLLYLSCCFVGQIRQTIFFFFFFLIGLFVTCDGCAFASRVRYGVM